MKDAPAFAIQITASQKLITVVIVVIVILSGHWPL
jgi:hypothetical protein